MNTTLKMKIVFGSSGKKGPPGRKPVEEEIPSSMRPAVLPPGLLRHTSAATDAQESLRLLARQRKAQIRNRRIKRTVWAMGAAALGWWGLVAARAPESAVASSAVLAGALVAPTPVPASASPTTSTTVAVPTAAVPTAALPTDTDAKRITAGLVATRPAGFLAGAAGQTDLSTASGDPAVRCEDDFSHGHWRAAIDSCGLAFDAQPGAPLALKIAHAQWSSGKVERAGVWARKAVDLGTADADAFVLIGHSKRQAGDITGAMVAYRRYLRWSPRGWHARDVRAALRDLKEKAALDADVAAVAAPGPS